MTEVSVASHTRENAFQQCMLGLSYSLADAQSADLFSQACVEQYEVADFRSFGYLFAQVFEPAVLEEVALLAGVAGQDAEQLVHAPSASIQRLSSLARQVDALSVVESVGVAAALISISRFSLAEGLLRAAHQRATNARERFEVAMLQFVCANRTGRDAKMSECFGEMRAAAESARLPTERLLDACSQAVVWFMKAQALEEADFRWFLDRGDELLRARQTQIDAAALSSWYRARAMVPAGDLRPAETREYMAQALLTAQAAVASRPRAYDLHLVKTYYESSLKEHMYVTHDAAAAEDAGRELIILDPAWSPSYGELAQALAFFKRPAEAAALYEQAVRLGPPYVGHHRLAAARCHSALGDIEAAMLHYEALLEYAPANARLIREALAVARSGQPAAVAALEAAEGRLYA